MNLRRYYCWKARTEGQLSMFKREFTAQFHIYSRIKEDAARFGFDDRNGAYSIQHSC